jgi:hypothetical protein
MFPPLNLSNDKYFAILDIDDVEVRKCNEFCVFLGLLSRAGVGTGGV